MKALVLADLDDTLFQTRRKLRGRDDGGLVVMSRLIDGSPSGHATPVQRALLGLFDGCAIVPVTARSREALSRVDVPAAPAVCANGGCILGDDGELDAGWHALLGERAAASAAASGAGVDDVLALVDARRGSLDVRRWIVAEAGLPLYVVAKGNAPEGTDLDALRASLAGALPDGWRTHVNDNNLALLPPWLAKRDAVAHLLPRLRRGRPDVPVIGVGDSLSDAGFMDLCDYALAPTGSQLWRAAVADSPWLDSRVPERMPDRADG